MRAAPGLHTPVGVESDIDIDHLQASLERVFSYKTDRCLSTLEGHGSSVRSVAWSHDAALLASASDDDTVKIWDAKTGCCLSTLKGHRRSVNSVAWSHDAALLASASTDKTVKIWDAAVVPSEARCDL